MNSRALQLAFVGDDFTGSTDALEQLALAGLRTALFTALPTADQLAAAGPLDAFGVATHARSLDPAALEATLRPLFAALRELRPRHVHYKVCSTFDSSPQVGSIGRALEIGADVFRRRFVPLVVGAPRLGRYCAFGHLFARDGIGSAGAVYRLDRHPVMSRHPVTPAYDADLRDHLARQTALRVALVDFLALNRTPAEAFAAVESALGSAPAAILFDVLTDPQLGRIGEILQREAGAGGPLFSIGSSAIEMALAASLAGAVAPGPWPELGAADPLLVLSGSCSAVTARQIAWAEAHGFSIHALDLAAAARGETTAALNAAVRHSLRAGRSVVLATSRGETDPALAATSAAARGRLGTALGLTARAVLADVPVPRVLVSGGDSSSYAATALGLERLQMIAPLTPGAPLCRACAPGSPLDGREIVFKGGQVGADDFFGRVARGR
jgi:uncharacterized protein YgbK (DUF1537 family)